MYRKLEKLPTFELLQVGIGAPSSRKGEALDNHGGHELWRRYKLTVPEFECEILEVFPDRKMFSLGETWLLDGHPQPVKVGMDKGQSLDDAQLKKVLMMLC